MRYWGLDVLKCVHCKSFPLEIYVIEKEAQNIDTSTVETPFCKVYCGFLRENIQQSKEYPCRECIKIAIKTAALYCPSCKHWYPIRDGIVVMLTDNKRKVDRDLDFLRTYSDKIPDFILKEGLPVNLLSKRKED
ncbi:MAG: Trm112 family protein [Desulfurococcaceae archaeon]